MQCVNKKCTAEIVDGAVFCHVCGRRQRPEPRRRIKRANGTGTVYKLSGRRRRPWVAAKDGVIIDYFETQTEALQLINKLNSKPITITDRYNMTFAEIKEAWSEEHYRDLKSEKGKEGYETAYDHFSELHDRRFRDLRTPDFQKPIDAMINKGRSRSTTGKMKQLANQMSEWARREEIIEKNFAEFVKLQENKKPDRKMFSKPERDKIDKAALIRDEAKIVKIMNNTGMRIGEFFSLETEKVHEHYCIGGEKTEAGIDRIIPFPPEIWDDVAYFRKRAEGKLLLIDGYEGNRTAENYRKRDYKDLLTDLGIEYKPPHCTRRTYATVARNSGMEPELLQQILGHAQYSTTADFYIIDEKEVEKLIAAATNINKKKVEKKKSAKV